MTHETLASKNFFALSKNAYPGRGIVLGVSSDGAHLVQIYWIMGRSPNSRNRVFVANGGQVFTEAADPAKVQDPSLIIYNAMHERRDDGVYFVVSNGAQTDEVVDCIPQNYLVDALESWEYEPDSPNFTPRITAVWSFTFRNDPYAEISILRKSPHDDSCDRIHFQYARIPDAFGYCVTTYSGDGDPLPAFCGEPLLVPIGNDIKLIAETYWSALDEANRVSLAVKLISLVTLESSVHLINKYSKV